MGMNMMSTPMVLHSEQGPIYKEFKELLSKRKDLNLVIVTLIKVARTTRM